MLDKTTKLFMPKIIGTLPEKISGNINKDDLLSGENYIIYENKEKTINNSF
jgi:hypothetical protein